MGRKRRSILLYLVLTAVVAGCSRQPNFDSVYTQVETASLRSGSEIPKPEQVPILTVSGKIGTRNKGQTIVMDLPTLEAAGLVKYVVEDPFEQEKRTFTGVLMKDLLNLWQVSADATSLNVIALNDYEVAIPIELVKNYPVIFALKQDGEYMTPDYRGPAMMVFPYDHYKFDMGTDAYWAWQIERIVVK